MNIAYDIDGCLRDLMGMVQEVWIREVPEASIKPITAYALAPFFLRDGNQITNEEITDFLFVKNVQIIYYNAVPFSGLDTLKTLKNMGHNIILVSDQPNKETTDATFRWLKLHDVTYDSIVITGDKYDVDFDIILEDSPRHIKSFIENNKKFVVRDQLYNKIKGHRRVYSLAEYANIIMQEDF